MTLDDSNLEEFNVATLADTLKKLEQGEKTAAEMERMLNRMDDRIELLLHELETLNSEQVEQSQISSEEIQNQTNN